MWRIVPKRAVSGAIGWGASRGIPGAAARRRCCRASRASTGSTSTEAEKPLGRLRRLRRVLHPAPARRRAPHRRRSPGAIVSPADGTVVECGLATAGKLIQAKGSALRSGRAARRRGDRGAASKGAPTSSPTCRPRTTTGSTRPSAGASSAGATFRGRCSRSAPRASPREPGLFVRNERFVTLIEMDGGGLCAVVMVAAIGVGHVTVSYDAEVATHRPRFLRAGGPPSSLRRSEAHSGAARSWASSTSARRPSSCSSRAASSSTRFAAGEAMKMGVGIGRARAANGTSAVSRG